VDEGRGAGVGGDGAVVRVLGEDAFRTHAPCAGVEARGAGLEDSENSATRKGWSERSERCDELMKFGLSSSGCETRPEKGRTAPTGSEPCDGRGDATGDA
jgi:hypothetical protein